MAEKVTVFDPAQGLTSNEAIAAFMAEAFASEDSGYVAHALGVVTRAEGMKARILAAAVAHSDQQSATTPGNRGYDPAHPGRLEDYIGMDAATLKAQQAPLKN